MLHLILSHKKEERNKGSLGWSAKMCTPNSMSIQIWATNQNAYSWAHMLDLLDRDECPYGGVSAFLNRHPRRLAEVENPWMPTKTADILGLWRDRGSKAWTPLVQSLHLHRWRTCIPEKGVLCHRTRASHLLALRLFQTAWLTSPLGQ